MSTPPEQPSASPYSPPPQGSGGYGTPVPPQHNPYAQTPPAPGQAAGQAPGQLPGQAPWPAPGAAPGAPGAPAGGGRGGAGKAVLWAAVGAVIASAAWGGALFLRKDSGGADLRGYKVVNDLCTSSDLSPFAPDYQGSSSHTAYSSKGSSVDSMTCSLSMETPTGAADPESAYTFTQVDLHKKTDPGGEFTDTWKGFSQHKDEKYTVTSLPGLGDEAYLITADSLTSTDSGERYVTVAVRDGWTTFSMNWTQFGDMDNAASAARKPTIDKVTGWVEASAKGTLAKLKK